MNLTLFDFNLDKNRLKRNTSVRSFYIDPRSGQAEVEYFKSCSTLKPLVLFYKELIHLTYTIKLS